MTINFTSINKVISTVIIDDNNRGYRQNKNNNNLRNFFMVHVAEKNRLEKNLHFTSYHEVFTCIIISCLIRQIVIMDKRKMKVEVKQYARTKIAIMVGSGPITM